MKRQRKIVAIILFVSICIVGIGLSYLYMNGLSGMQKNTEAKDGQIKVACVGDSVTYGYGVSSWSENNYPKVLGNLLGEAYNVQNFGSSGRAVQTDSSQPYVVEEIYVESLSYEADIVVFMMGSNDTKPENWKGEDSFKAELCALLDSYLEGEKKPEIYLCTPATAFYLGEEQTGPAYFDIQPDVVTKVASIVREVAKERGYPLIDINAMTAEHEEWFETDGIHPDKDGAAAIAKEVYDAIK